MTRQMILAAAAAATLGLAGGCASSDEAPFDPRGMTAAQREAARGLAPSEVVALPAKLDSLADSDKTPKEKFRNEPLLNRLDARPRVVRVDLRQAIQRAVANNLDVRVASYQPAIEESRVTEADARFDPTIFANPTIEGNSGLSPAANGSLIGSNFTRVTLETGVKQVNEWGGEYTLQYTAQEIDSHQGAGNPLLGQTAGINQFYNELKFQLTQPLMRDFGADVNNARIVINRNNQHVALLDFREQLEKSLTDLEQTYWQLVQARREVEIQQELLQNTINTANTLFLRKDQDVNRLQISQANASIETRRAQLVRAEAHVDDLSDQLKQFMSDPSLPLAGPDLVLPATPPALQQVVLDPQEQIDAALLNRTELGQQQLRIDSAMVALRVAKNNKLPRFDFVGSAALQGADEIYSRAFNDMFEFSDFTGVLTAGVQFEYPLGNRAANAIFRRAQLQALQASDSYRQIIEKVILEVKAATREVNTTWNETVRTKQATFAAADALRAVQVREDAGEALTPEFVDLKLRQQELLADSQRQEAAAISNYNIALSKLERTKGTLLKYNNVMLEEASLPRGS